MHIIHWHRFRRGGVVTANNTDIETDAHLRNDGDKLIIIFFGAKCDLYS